MSISRNTILAFLLLGMSVSCMYAVLPKPELTVSILIRLLSTGIALYIAARYRVWTLVLLAAMFFLMGARQVLTLLIWMNVVEKSESMRFLSEVPGFAVTLLSLLSIVYVGLIVSGNLQLMKKQEDSIDTLNKLLPICSKCKRIRNDDGYWEEVETYIRNRTDTDFSHGLCRECADELYGQEAWYQQSQKKLDGE